MAQKVAMLEDDISQLNKAIKEDRYLVYDRKKHSKFQVIFPIYYQVYRRCFVLSDNFLLVKGKVVLNPKQDNTSLTEPRLNSREKWFDLTKEEIYTELFRINGGREGWYLVDLKDRKYWYFESEKALDNQLLESNIGLLVPVIEFQQN